METLNELVTQAEAWRRGRLRDEYRRRVGPLPDWAPEAEEATWPTPQTVRDLQTALRATDAPQALGIRHVLRFAIGEYLLRQTYVSSANLLEQQQSAVIQVPVLDEPVPFWQVGSRLALERKRVLREALENATTGVIQGFQKLHRELWSSLFATVEALGYPNLIALWEELLGMPLDAFLRPLEAILRETEHTYRDRMQWHLKRLLGIRLETAKRHDILALFGSEQTAAWFPRADMLTCLQHWLRDWGWQIEQYANLSIEQGTAMSAGGWCVPFEIPADIRLAVAPSEGMRGYAQAFREAGKALFLASLPADLPRELRCLPDPSLLEGQAELFGVVTRTSRWVQIYRHISQPEEALSLAQLERLFIVRRYIGKCLYERTFYEDSGLDGKEEAYRDALRQACGFAYPEAYYLYDIDPGFGSFWNVRGWALCATLHRRLHQQYAEEWFREAEARLALEEFWRQSPSRPVEALMGEVGGMALDVDAVVADLLSDL
ncbi:MAG TPA: hypothetical protein VLK82_12245 [Candidatus Tectomicrobia bacterium]|nr:hypothetical protein [Candidatus Tectomicrobia bacterium]